MGKTRDQLLGKTVFDISPKDLARIYHGKDKELFESGGTQQYESKVLNANGEIRDVIFDKSVCIDGKGKVIGLIGTGIGTILGVLICYILKEWEFIKLPDVYAFAELPVQLEVADVLIIAGSAVLICFLSTLYPAYQAAKIDPVEAIRYG